MLVEEVSWNKECRSKWGWLCKLTEGAKISVDCGKQGNEELGGGRRRMAPEAWEEKSRGTGLKTSRTGKNG